MKPEDVDRIERYTRNERSLHWVTAISFVLLALSGLALFHPAMFWLSALFGGGQWARIVHPFIGIVMVIAFVALALRVGRHNVLDRDDVQWLRQFDDVLAGREASLPPVGRYNAGQKVLFFFMAVCTLLLLLSGVAIWRRYFGSTFSVETIRAASVIHAAVAFLFIVGIIVHVYAAIWVKGSISAMVRGTVTLGWARKHHPKWFRQSVK